MSRNSPDALNSAPMSKVATRRKVCFGLGRRTGSTLSGTRLDCLCLETLRHTHLEWFRLEPARVFFKIGAMGGCTGEMQDCAPLA